MTPTRVNLLPFVTIIAICCRPSAIGSSALRVVTSPAESFNELIHPQLNITCIPDGATYWAKDIVTMQIQKDHLAPIVVLRKRQVVFGPNKKSNMKAEGHIEADASESFLRLTVENPGRQDVGTYSCLMFYLDESLGMKEEKAETNVTVDNEGVSAIVQYLTGKLSHLEDILRTQGQVISEQENRLNDQQEKVLTLNKTAQDQNVIIDRQQKEINAQQVELTHQKAKLVNQETVNQNQTGTIYSLLQKIDIQGRQLQEQHVTIGKQKTQLNAQKANWDNHEKLAKIEKDKILDLKRKIDDQEKRLRKRVQRVVGNNGEDSPMPAFSAGFNSIDQVVAGEILIFRDPIFTIGNAYNFTTGVFTAPVTGLYVFQLSVMVRKSNGWIYIDLKSNDGKTVGSLQGHDINHADQSFMSTVVPLQAGNTLVPVVTLVQDVHTFFDLDHFTRFSGYLLRM